MSSSPDQSPHLRARSGPLSGRQWAIVIAIFILGLLLRGVGLGEKPRIADAADDVHYLWVGISLLEGRAPLSWSSLRVYDRYNAIVGELNYRGAPLSFVRPALDHPPAFSLLAGAYAKLIGALGPPIPLENPAFAGASIPDINLTRARTLCLILYGISFFLMLEIGRRDLGFLVTALALLIHACLATTILHGRMLVVEHLTTPLFLLGLLALQRLRDGIWSERRFAVVVSLSVAVSVLCKIAALSQGGAFAVLLYLMGRKRAILWPVLGGALGVAGYIAYGMALNGDLLFDLLASHSRRYSGVNPWFTILANQKIALQGASSQMVLIGWISLFILNFRALRGSRPTLLFAAPILYVVGFCFFMSLRELYGWHLVPIFPFLAFGYAAVAVGLVRQVGAGYAFPWITALALLAPASGQFAFDLYAPVTEPVRYGYVVTMALGLGVLILRKREDRMKAAGLALVALTLLLLARELEMVRMF